MMMMKMVIHTFAVLEDLYVLKALPWSEVSLPTPVCKMVTLTSPFRKELLSHLGGDFHIAGELCIAIRSFTE